MKKLLLLLLLVTTGMTAQVSNGTETQYDGLQVLSPQTVTAPTHSATMGADGTIGKALPANLPINTSPVNFAPATSNMSGYFSAIDTRLGQIGNTTAGITNRIYFTGDNVTVTAGTFFASNGTGKGTATSGLPMPLVNGDNQKQYFNKDVLSIAQPSATTAPPGNYSGQLTVSSSPTPNGTQQRYTIEIYKTNNGGTPIASGITGAPTGSLGVTVVAILDSGLVNLVAGAITNIVLNGNLASTLSLATGERLRYHVSAQKVGSGGGNVTMSVLYGSDYNSYYDVTVSQKTSTVINDSGVVGVTASDALNNLNTSINTLGDYSSFKSAVTVINDGLYNAFPSIEKASNGDLLTVYRKGVDHLTFDGSIRLKRSTDNGNTWGSETTLVSSGGHDYRDPSITRLANGNIIMSYFDRITDTNRLIYTSISTDNGSTFGTPVSLTGYDYGSVSSKVVQLTNGDLLLSTYGKTGANGLLNVFKSTNLGTSWSILSTISTDVFGSALKYTEPSLILATNGDIIATIRNDSNGQVSRAISTDSGVTWSSVVDKFTSNSRAPMFYAGNKLVVTYRVSSGAGLRYSLDSGVTFSEEVQLNNLLIGEQDEYNSIVEIKPNVYGLVYSVQNSTATQAGVYFKYLNNPISLGTIPYIQTEGVISTGASTFKSMVNLNTINGISGDIILNTNTVSTSRDIVLRAGNNDVFRAKGTGYGQFINRVGFGTAFPMNITGAYIPAGTGGGMSLQNLAGNAEYARFGVVNPGTVNDSYIGSISNNAFSIYTNNVERLKVSNTGAITLGTVPVTSAGTFYFLSGNNTTNIVEKVLSNTIATVASPTFTGDPKAPTPTAGDNDTSIATTAFVQSSIGVGTTYTPTLTNTTNIASSTLTLARYTKVGKLVTAYIALTLVNTLASTSSRLKITLPSTAVTSSAFGNGIAYEATVGITQDLIITSSGSSTQVDIDFLPSAVLNRTLLLSFSYMEP